jgi:hypothetical protein
MAPFDDSRYASDDLNPIKAGLNNAAASALSYIMPAGYVDKREFRCGDVHGTAPKPGGGSFSFNLERLTGKDFANPGDDGYKGVFDVYVAHHNGSVPEAKRTAADFLGMPADDRPAPRHDTASRASSKPSTWIEVEAPQDAPAPDFGKLWPRVTFKHAWPYLSETGLRLFFVARYEDEQGEKLTPAVTWGHTGDGKCHWRAKGSAQNILFGLEFLPGRPDAEAWVFEGEKTATAARILFPDVICLAWKGGAGNVRNIDWSPLAGRRVRFIADADHNKSGEKAMGVGSAAALKCGAESAIVATMPADFPDGWDVADLDHTDPAKRQPAGWTLEKIRAHIETACSQPEPAAKGRKAASGRRSDRPRGAASDSSDLPIIQVIAGKLPETVDNAEATLIARGCPVYQRGGILVKPAKVRIDVADEKQTTGTRLIPLTANNIAEMVMRNARVEKYDARSQDFVPTDFPMRAAETLLDRVGEWEFPVLTGLINAPTLRRDGSILDQPGYDAATGLLFDPQGVRFPAVLDRPTKEHATAALAVLNKLICTFPFVSETDRSVALSGILTALVRRSIPTAPLHGFSAPTAGSGKSMLVDIASMIASGRQAAVYAQGKTEEEAEKSLGAALIAGDALISIDNCEHPLGGERLCQALTQRSLRIRILGQSLNVEVPSNASVFATGNNLTVLGDMTRRTLLCTLDPECERPETRLFDANPIDLIQRDRGRYAVAALTIMRAFHVAGSPRQNPPLGSFEAWSGLVRDALVWAGAADPVTTMDKVRETDPKLQQLTSVVDQWHHALGERSATVKDVIELAVRSTMNGFNRPEFINSDFREALLVVAGENGVINSRKLGKWLASNKGRVVNGLRLIGQSGHASMMTWRLLSVSQK